MILVLEIIGSGIVIFFVWFAVVSFKENESRALKRSLLLSILLPITILSLIMLSHLGNTMPACIFLVFCALILITILIPLKGKNKIINDIPASRYDERDTMFSRSEISGNSARQANYYRLNPENQKIDKEWKSNAGLMSPASAMYSPVTFNAAEATFFTIEQLRSFVDGEISSEKKEFDPQKMSVFIEKWAKDLGAISVGFCEMKEYHYYSVRGRGDAYGEEVVPKHKYGIAITIEMDKDFLATGPAAPTLMESAKQYLNSGVIAIQIAKYIRGLGHGARAHIDGNYEVICPLVARDAGLGEIGRMGLLMTPELGPRVRIAVITTDIPLTLTQREPDFSIDEFCGFCKKCAKVCPSQAISKKQKTKIEGVERWQVNHEKCFTYWSITGTDCGRCMSVCPYSHPNNSLHNMVRRGIKNNWIFRRLALQMDDFFYGKKSKAAKIPEWMDFEETV